ncbi:MAG: hypothetical protein Q7R98_00310 [Candidatus Jorgensenbacteria bacterium]|nr:hypothetical protein [Candidatus Jorgensenbacteria bacterium]
MEKRMACFLLFVALSLSCGYKENQVDERYSWNRGIDTISLIERWDIVLDTNGNSIYVLDAAVPADSSKKYASSGKYTMHATFWFPDSVVCSLLDSTIAAGKVNERVVLRLLRGIASAMKDGQADLLKAQRDSLCAYIQPFRKFMTYPSPIPEIMLDRLDALLKMLESRRLKGF